MEIDQYTEIESWFKFTIEWSLFSEKVHVGSHLINSSSFICSYREKYNTSYGIDSQKFMKPWKGVFFNEQKKTTLSWYDSRISWYLLLWIVTCYSSIHISSFISHEFFMHEYQTTVNRVSQETLSNEKIKIAFIVNDIFTRIFWVSRTNISIWIFIKY